MKILDACCGGKMFWFDKNYPDATFMDIRRFCRKLCDGRTFEVSPDVIGDFRNMPFENEIFDLVVFDPPHLVRGGDNAWQVIKYGKLNKESIFDDLSKGFSECFRVLKKHGILIFKWNEIQVKVSQILKCCQHKPLFGQKGGKTHWLVFIKPEGNKARGEK